MRLSTSKSLARRFRKQESFVRTFSSCLLQFPQPSKQVKWHHNRQPIRFCSTVITPFIMADIGEGISEVEVLQWYVKTGDRVEQFTPLCEVQSDKATVPISSRYEGRIAKIYYPTGTVAKVGTPLCDIEMDASLADADSAPPSPSSTSHARAPTTPKSQQPAQSAAPPQSTPSSRSAATSSQSGGKLLASPAVRFLAKKENVDLSGLRGSGRDGMVTKGDLLAHISDSKVASMREMITANSVQAPPVPSSPSLPQGNFKSHPLPQFRTEDEVVVLKGFKKAMAVSMNESLSIPHFGYCDEIDMSNLMTVRDKLKDAAKSQGVSLNYLPFFIKAASLAMLSYPDINSTLSPDMKFITRLAGHNIAIAIATPSGLVVPNIKQVQNLSIHQISLEIQRLVSLANANKLNASDLTGSTFTLSNIGSLGGTYASPVLVSPQVVIGALGKIQKLPRFDQNGNVIPAQIMQISWSGDHRVIDGATIALFSNLFKDFIENPSMMMLYLK